MTLDLDIREELYFVFEIYAIVSKLGHLFLKFTGKLSIHSTSLLNLANSTLSEILVNFTIKNFSICL